MSLNLGNIQRYFATQPILKAWLFGSFARGEETESSDVDILVRFDDKARVGLMRHAEIMLHLEDMTGRRVDLVTEGSFYPEVASHVDTDKILIYERGT